MTVLYIQAMYMYTFTDKIVPSWVSDVIDATFFALIICKDFEE